MEFLRNAWYMAGWHSSLSEKPLARLILGVPVVLFKTASGAVSALHDRCPHRAVPLHMGTVKGEGIRCVYHGLEFDRTGVCTANPHIKGSPEKLCVKSYPLVVRHGAMWIWMGQGDKADPATIPDYTWFDEPGAYAVARGYTHVAGDYRILMDNLLDLSHAEYLHAGTVGTPGSSGTARSNVVAGQDWVTVERKVFGLAPSAVFRSHWTKSELIDQKSDMTWRPGSNLLLDLLLTAAGDSSGQGLHFPSAHLLTPETATSTHYFWGVARNFAQDDSGLTDAICSSFQTTFTDEDKPVIEAIQQAFDLEGDAVTVTSFTVGDGGGLRARRMLQSLIEHVDNA